MEQWDEIVPAEERAACGAICPAALIQGKRESDEYEQHFIRRDGRIVLATGGSSYSEMPPASHSTLSPLTEDITERKRARRLSAKESNSSAPSSRMRLSESVFANSLVRQYSPIRALHEMLGCTHAEY